MYLIKTYLDKSPIEGIGVFAGADIPKGTLIWQFIAGVDTSVDREKIAGLPEIIQKHLERHAYCANGKLILCGDHGQYTNHSDSPNTGAVDGSDAEYALRDIRKGEEITCDYRAFDEEFTLKLPALEAV